VIFDGLDTIQLFTSKELGQSGIRNQTVYSFHLLPLTTGKTAGPYPQLVWNTSEILWRTWSTSTSDVSQGDHGIIIKANRLASRKPLITKLRTNMGTQAIRKQDNIHTQCVVESNYPTCEKTSLTQIQFGSNLSGSQKATIFANTKMYPTQFAAMPWKPRKTAALSQLAAVPPLQKTKAKHKSRNVPKRTKVATATSTSTLSISSALPPTITHHSKSARSASSLSKSALFIKEPPRALPLTIAHHSKSVESSDSRLVDSSDSMSTTSSSTNSSSSNWSESSSNYLPSPSPPAYKRKKKRRRQSSALATTATIGDFLVESDDSEESVYLNLSEDEILDKDLVQEEAPIMVLEVETVPIQRTHKKESPCAIFNHPSFTNMVLRPSDTLHGMSNPLINAISDMMNTKIASSDPNLLEVTHFTGKHQPTGRLFIRHCARWDMAEYLFQDQVWRNVPNRPAKIQRHHSGLVLFSDDKTGHALAKVMMLLHSWLYPLSLSNSRLLWKPAFLLSKDLSPKTETAMNSASGCVIGIEYKQHLIMVRYVAGVGEQFLFHNLDTKRTSRWRELSQGYSRITS
jgi:hypothetical protein